MPQKQTITASDGTILDAGVVNLSKAIRQTESRGDYNAKGGSGEFGAYQWMPETWQKHAQLAGVDPNDRSPVTQDKVAYKVIEARKNAGLTPEQIVSEWNSGKPDAYKQNWRGYNKQGVYYDTPAYTQKVIEHFQQLKQGQNPQAPITPSTIGAQNPDTLRSDLEARKQQFLKSQEQVGAGEINPARGLLRAAGAGAGAVADTLSRGFSALVPDAIEKPVMEHIAGKVQNVAQSPLGQSAIRQGTQFAEKHPEVTQDIKDTGNIAGIIPIGFGGGIAAKTAGKAVASQATKTIENTAAKQVAKLADDYRQIFDTRSPLRGRIDRAKQKGRDLAEFLAEKAKGPTGAKLEVNSDGAVDASKLAAKIDEDLNPLYQARTDLLKQYPEQADVETFRQLALKAADSTQNKGKTIVAELHKDINEIFDQMKVLFGERFPLEALQDIKIGQRIESKAFNALKPKRDRFSNANYIVSDTARRYLEDITQNPLVREINDLIGEHLDADDLLERVKIGGAKVKGGRLGKYAGIGVGTMMGSAMESAFGPLMGGLAGNYMAGLILKNQVSGPLRNFLLKRLQAEQPDVYKKLEDFIGAEELRRSSMLQLPEKASTPKMFVSPSGKAGGDLQEIIDAEAVTKGLIKPPRR